METAEEVSLREFFEEISGSRKGKRITMDNYQQLIHPKEIGYLQCHVDDKQGWNNRTRLIGLFVWHIDERERNLRFQLRDKKENQVNQYGHRYSFIHPSISSVFRNVLG